MSLFKTHGVVKFKRIGINEASTFTGFCAVHDDRTFAPLEKQPLTASPEQCFLMSYRAICRELFQKRIHNSNVGIMRGMDQGAPRQIQEAMQWFTNLHEIGILMGLAEIQHHKDLYDEMLRRNNFDPYRRLIIRFSCVPDVLSTGAFAPEHDFSGNRFQNLLDDPPLKNIAVTVLPADGGGVAVLGWQEGSDAVCIPFVESLISIGEESLGNAVLRLVFEHIENTFFRPSWWEELPEATQQALIRRTNSGASPATPRGPSCLRDDKLNYVDWPVTSVEAQFPRRARL
ncbi:hypothetical protein [Alloacidobacterium dinghuense]|nr:hypothetical protein [Alloacidobacterium dinghuense]